MTAKRMIFLVLFAGSIGWVNHAHGQEVALNSASVEFHRAGQRIDAKSPDGKSVVAALPPLNDDADPKMIVHSDGHTLSLGALKRSAAAFWRPDSRVVAISDYPYSNHFVVRLVRVQPQLSEVTNVDQIIKSRVRHEFHTPSLVHYWPQVQGWTRNGQLLVVACADGVSPHGPRGTPLVGFARGYVIDTNRLAIISELSPVAYTKLVGKDACR